MKQRFILILIYVFLLVKPIHLLAIEPDVFIQSTVNRAAQTLSGNFTKEERIQKLKEIAKETVDIEGISLYSLVRLEDKNDFIRGSWFFLYSTFP